METKRIAKTILNQIKATDFWALAAWGATRYVTCPGNKANVLGGLNFHVQNTPKVRQGIVSVELMASDTYSVKVYTPNGRLLGGSSGLYCDQLVDTLSEMLGR